MVVDEDVLGVSSSKRTLFTREKLRAGEHDPKGLLDLVSTSASALEHTKKLELLKASGYILTSKNKLLKLRNLMLQLHVWNWG